MTRQSSAKTWRKLSDGSKQRPHSRWQSECACEKVESLAARLPRQNSPCDPRTSARSLQTKSSGSLKLTEPPSPDVPEPKLVSLECARRAREITQEGQARARPFKNGENATTSKQLTASVFNLKGRALGCQYITESYPSGLGRIWYLRLRPQ